ncbi:hypothetical protein PVK06_014934 [Gossypium arboreum]|uniref:Uncharacterized protein n=1 Tax=Gossypium arboreum TaxID=29729 RepID=A0ABR0PWC6_GOSAR|nr:hypothetical protein PVK06_014934 [Gossypium arboreum]
MILVIIRQQGASMDSLLFNQHLSGAKSSKGLLDSSSQQNSSYEGHAHFRQSDGYKVRGGKSSYRDCARGRYGYNRPQCQLFGKIEHLVIKCYYRFDHTF